MNPGTTPGPDEQDRLFDQVVSHYDAPAYVRRGRQVEAAWQQLLDQCRAQQIEWQQMPAMRLGQLRARAGDLTRLTPLLANMEQLDVLRKLHAELNPQLRVSLPPSTSERLLREALRELCASLERFNRRWLDYLWKVDLTVVNQLREGYNRYYLLEKECALRSPVLARINFQWLEPLTLDALLTVLPSLPVPRLRE